MPRYEGSDTTSVTTAAVDTVLAELYAPTRELFLREVHLFTVTAPTTVGRLSLKRQTFSASVFITQNGIARDPRAPAPTALIETTWPTGPPTVQADPGGACRRFTCPAAVGNGIIWTWYEDDGLVIPVQGGICVCNAGATAPGTWYVGFTWEE